MEEIDDEDTMEDNVEDSDSSSCGEEIRTYTFISSSELHRPPLQELKARVGDRGAAGVRAEPGPDHEGGRAGQEPAHVSWQESSLCIWFSLFPGSHSTYSGH